MKKKVLIASGGTGGHIFPGIEVAKYLKSKGWKVCWVSSYKEIDSFLLLKNKIEYKCIDISSFGNFSFKSIFFLFLNF